MNKARIRQIVEQLLIELGEDPRREGLRETPRRVADLYEEVFSGYHSDPELDVVFDETSDLVMQREIPFYSMCEHHLLPFFGKAHIAYQPNGRVIGISKLSRLVEKYARRLQLQERMTNQIANELEQTEVRGALVVIEGEHLCLRMRGAKSNGVTVTSAGRGTFAAQEVRARILDLMLNSRKGAGTGSQVASELAPVSAEELIRR